MELREAYRSAGAYSRTVLPNGLTVVTQRTGSPDIGVSYVIGYGGGNEPAEIKGAAHFAEHLFFEAPTVMETERVRMKMERLTGSAPNAFTVSNYINFGPESSVGYRTYPDDLRDLLGVVYDAVSNTLSTDEQFERQRAAIINELKADEGTPLLDFKRQSRRIIWQDHPHGESPGGTIESIRCATPGMLDRTRQYMKANNGYLALCGNLPDGIMHTVSETFGNMESGLPAPQFPEVHPMPTGLDPLLGRFDDVGENSIEVCFSIRPSPADSYRLNILTRYIGNGINSVLMRRLRDKERLCYGVGSGLVLYNEGGLAYVGASHFDEDAKGKIITAIDEELEKIRQGTIDQELATLAKNTAIRSYYHGRLEGMPTRAFGFVSRDMRNSLDIETQFDIVMAMTPDDLQRTVQKYLTDRRVVIGVFRS